MGECWPSPNDVRQSQIVSYQAMAYLAVEAKSADILVLERETKRLVKEFVGIESASRPHAGQ